MQSPPAGAPRPDRTACWAEAVALAGLGLIIFALTATNPSTNGLLLRLGDLSTGIATVHVLVAVAAFIGLAAAVVLALRGRGVAATLTAAAVCAISTGGPGSAATS